MHAALMLTNCDSAEEAQKIADALLAKELAAAVQIIGPVDSRYRWQGRINEKHEWIIMIKTNDEQETAVSSTIKALHSYELPGILKVAVESTAPEYLQWILDNSSPSR